jgi:hypothetical protein
MIAATPIVLEATAEVSDGDTDAAQDDDGCADDEAAGNNT